MTDAQKSFTASAAFVVLLGALTAFDPLSIDMYLSSFPDIQASFGTTFSKVELSVSAFFVGMAFGQLIYGPLADHYGRRKPLIAGMLLYMAATIGCAFAPNIETFIALRVLQSLGGCAGMVITRAIARDLFEKKRVAEFMSSMALVMGIAPILAPSIGSVITHLWNWQAIFITLTVANIFCFLCIIWFLPETCKNPTPTLRLSTTFKTYGSLLKDRSFLRFLIPDAAIRAGMFAYIAGSPFVFIELFHVPKEHYGWIFGLNGLGLMAAAQVNRRLLRKFEPEVILRWSVRLAALAGLVVFIAAQVSTAPLATLIPLFGFLACLNFVGPNALAGALSGQGHQAGTASALYGCLQWSLATLSSYFVSHFHNGTSLPMTGVILGCGLISAVSFQFLMKPGAKITPRDLPVPSEAEPGP